MEEPLYALAVVADAVLFSDELGVLADAGLDCGIEGGGVSQGSSHFIPFGRRLDPH